MREEGGEEGQETVYAQRKVLAACLRDVGAGSLTHKRRVADVFWLS